MTHRSREERPSGRRGFSLVPVGIALTAAMLAGIAFLVSRPAATTGHEQQSAGAPVSLATSTAPAATATAFGTPLSAAGRPTASRTPTAPGLPLLGRRIGLDPGHGPRGDAGAVMVDPDTGKLVLTEAEFNLDVALRCRDLLRARGADVVLTRETADTFTAPWPVDANGDGIVGDVWDDLQERVDILNKSHVEVFMSIHANSTADPAGRQGIQGFYCASSDCAFPAESKRLGNLALDQLEAKLASAGYPVQQRLLRNDLWPDFPGGPATHLFLLGPVKPPNHVRATAMPGVVVESLYVTSPAEAALLKLGVVRQAIALAYADALQAYLLTAGK